MKTHPGKIRAVDERPTPLTQKELKQCLGFTHFYRCFIRNYSQVVAPLTHLNSIKIPFTWSIKAKFAFSKLKQLFTSTSILITPNSSEHVIVEVDASDTGVTVVL